MYKLEVRPNLIQKKLLATRIWYLFFHSVGFPLMLSYVGLNPSDLEESAGLVL